MKIRTTDQMELVGPCLTEPHGMVDFATIQLQPGYVLANAHDIAALESKTDTSFGVFLEHSRLLCDDGCHPEYKRGIVELLASVFTTVEGMDSTIEMIREKMDGANMGKPGKEPQCPKCDSTLVLEEESDGYVFECQHCDEDFYGFEVKWREK